MCDGLIRAHTLIKSVRCALALPGRRRGGGGSDGVQRLQDKRSRSRPDRSDLLNQPSSLPDLYLSIGVTPGISATVLPSAIPATPPWRYTYMFIIRTLSRRVRRSWQGEGVVRKGRTGNTGLEIPVGRTKYRKKTVLSVT